MVVFPRLVKDPRPRYTPDPMLLLMSKELPFHASEVTKELSDTLIPPPALLSKAPGALTETSDRPCTCRPIPGLPVLVQASTVTLLFAIVIPFPDALVALSP